MIHADTRSLEKRAAAGGREHQRDGVGRRARWLLAALCGVVGLTAIGGGIVLVARPDGSLLQLPPSVLQYSPFEDFLLPGLLLLVVIGVGNAIAAALVLQDGAVAAPVAFAGGAALVVWIVVQMILLRMVEGLHVAFLLAGLAIMAEALRLRLAAAATVRA